MSDWKDTPMPSACPRPQVSEALLEGPEIFGRVRSLIRFPPPYVSHPAYHGRTCKCRLKMIMLVRAGVEIEHLDLEHYEHWHDVVGGKRGHRSASKERLDFGLGLAVRACSCL